MQRGRKPECEQLTVQSMSPPSALAPSSSSTRAFLALDFFRGSY